MAERLIEKEKKEREMKDKNLAEQLQKKQRLEKDEQEKLLTEQLLEKERQEEEEMMRIKEEQEQLDREEQVRLEEERQFNLTEEQKRLQRKELERLRKEHLKTLEREKREREKKQAQGKTRKPTEEEQKQEKESLLNALHSVVNGNKPSKPKDLGWDYQKDKEAKRVFERKKELQQVSQSALCRAVQDGFLLSDLPDLRLLLLVKLIAQTQANTCLSCPISCSTTPGVMRTSSTHIVHACRPRVICTLSTCHLCMRVCCPHQDTSSAHCLQAICTTPHGHCGPELSFTVTGICY